MSSQKLSLTARALRLQGMREHSRAELQKKLQAHETEPGEVGRVLDQLQAKGFINESRVVESVLYQRAGKLGAARVRQELVAKGLDADNIAQAMDRLRQTEVQRARAVWEKKFGKEPEDAAQRVRQMRFLAARGFAAEAIRKVIRGSDEDF